MSEWNGKEWVHEPKGLIVHSMGEIIKGYGPAEEFLKQVGLSVHWLISPIGELITCQSQDKSAWHAGKSKWQSLSNLNDYYLGVEVLVAGEHDYASFRNAINKPESFHHDQYVTLANLSRKLIHQYKWDVDALLQHSWVSGPDVREDYKHDPGEGFAWNSFIRMI